MLLFSGILVLSFIFLPLSFVLRAKEKKEKKDKIVIGLGVLAAISLSLGVLFAMANNTKKEQILESLDDTCFINSIIYRLKKGFAKKPVSIC